MRSKVNINALCECSILLALAWALSYCKPFPELPYGGAITIASMLPICLASIKHGIGWGLITAFCYSWTQILQGGVFAWGLTPGMLIASLLLDYIIAFTVLGLAGLFRKQGLVGKLGGILMVCFLRFLTHFIAGIVLWANFDQFIAFGAEWINQPVLYSLCYNGIYMLPDTAIVMVVAVLLFRLPQTKKILEVQA